MVATCSAYGCKERAIKGTSVTFHKFPKDRIRRRIWALQLKRENFQPSDSSRICSKHFKEECFDTTQFGGTWLKKDAVPTEFEFSSPLSKKEERKKAATKRKDSQDLNVEGKDFEKKSKKNLEKTVTFVDRRRKKVISKEINDLNTTVASGNQQSDGESEESQPTIKTEPTSSFEMGEAFHFQGRLVQETNALANMPERKHILKPILNTRPVIHLFSAPVLQQSNSSQSLKNSRLLLQGDGNIGGSKYSVPEIPNTYSLEYRDTSSTERGEQSSTPAVPRNKFSFHFNYWMEKLQSLRHDQQVFAEKLINDIFYEAEWGRLSHGCRIQNSS